MLTNIYLLTAALALTCYPDLIRGHGRMLEPISRPSGYLARIGTPVNYNDHEMNCGGRVVQWDQNGGKCGVCGDPWPSTPRPYERKDGIMVQHNIIPNNYTENQVISVLLQITVAHGGWHQFSLCDISDAVEATQACLDKTLLADQTGRTRFYEGTSEVGYFTFQLVLPAGLTCRHCFLQWRWKCGNDWGCDETGCGKGKGERQEEFYSCSDLTILSKTGENAGSTAASTSTSTGPSTLSTTSPTTTISTPTTTTTTISTPTTATTTISTPTTATSTPTSPPAPTTLSSLISTTQSATPLPTTTFLSTLSSSSSSTSSTSLKPIGGNNSFLEMIKKNASLVNATNNGVKLSSRPYVLENSVSPEIFATVITGWNLTVEHVGQMTILKQQVVSNRIRPDFDRLDQTTRDRVCAACRYRCDLATCPVTCPDIC